MAGKEAKPRICDLHHDQKCGTTCAASFEVSCIWIHVWRLSGECSTLATHARHRRTLHQCYIDREISSAAAFGRRYPMGVLIVQYRACAAQHVRRHGCAALPFNLQISLQDSRNPHMQAPPFASQSWFATCRASLFRASMATIPRYNSCTAVYVFSMSCGALQAALDSSSSSLGTCCGGRKTV